MRPPLAPGNPGHLISQAPGTRGHLVSSALMGLPGLTLQDLISTHRLRTQTKPWGVLTKNQERQVKIKHPTCKHLSGSLQGVIEMTPEPAASTAATRAQGPERCWRQVPVSRDASSSALILEWHCLPHCRDFAVSVSKKKKKNRGHTDLCDLTRGYRRDNYIIFFF